MASRLEETLLLHVRGAGLPEPETQLRFAPPLQYRFDLAWPDRDAPGGSLLAVPGGRLAVECDGGTWTGGRHVRGRGYEEDCFKLDLAVVLGWRIIRVTTAMVESGEALELIECAFGRRSRLELIERRVAAIAGRRSTGARLGWAIRRQKQQER